MASSSSSDRDQATALTSSAEDIIAEAEEEVEHDQAVYRAIQAAETAIKALSMAADNEQRAEISHKLDELLTRAEAIKTAVNWPLISSPPQQSHTLLRITPTPAYPPSRIEATLGPREEPQSTRELTQSEQILLLRNSKLHGFKFPPWKSAPETKHFVLKEGEFGEAESYVDSPDLQLSAKQRKAFAGWKHAAEALPPPSFLANGEPATMRTDQPIDLVQDVATDCSVVASLCAAVAREEKGHDRLLYKLIYPHDDQLQDPEFSDNGKYIVRLNFNGSYRYVTIDHRLPVSKSRRMLHILDRNNPGLVWPALLEKAYLKARGGYDFLGSNPGTDLWMLLGWIPEQVLLHDEETDFEEVWRSVKENFRQGMVLVTAGTGMMTRRTERVLGLVSKHAYAVLDLKEEGSKKLLLLKNPWSYGNAREKKENGSSGDLLNGDTDYGQDGALISWEDGKTLSHSAEDPLLSPASTTTTFWMDAKDLLQHFESVYLNWDPRRFTYRQDIHFPWNFGVADASTGSPTNNPQFVVQCASGPLWLLLCRHFNSREIDVPQSESLLLNGESDSNGYISIDVFDNNGERMRNNNSLAIKEGQYVDSSQTLLRLDRVQNKPYTVVVRAKDLPYGDYSFSLNAFATSRISLTKVLAEYKFTTSLKSAWTVASAGGNSQSSSYFANPQFQLSVSESCELSILLEGPNLTTNVNLKLLHSGGNRICKMVRQDIIKDSGDYRPGSASALVPELGPGKYTIICSTFQSGQEGNLTLRIQSTAKVELSQLPSELAGRFLIDRLPLAKFSPQCEKMALHIQPRTAIKITAIAKLMPSASQRNILVPVNSHTDMRLSIELGRGPNKQYLAVSGDGEYRDSSIGIRTKDLDLLPHWRSYGDIWLVLDRLSAPASGEWQTFKVDLLTDGQWGIDILTSEWRNWDD